MAIRAPAATAGSQRQELEHQMQPAAERRGDGVEQVDDPGEEDGRRSPSPHPAGPPMGLAEVGSGRPRLPIG